jgi:hypothetical protein
MDKVRGTRDLSYLEKKPHGPPVGAYSPKYNLIYPRIMNGSDFGNPLANSTSSPILKPSPKSSKKNHFFGERHKSVNLTHDASTAYPPNIDTINRDMFRDFRPKNSQTQNKICSKITCAASRVNSRQVSPFNTNNTTLQSISMVNMDAQLPRASNPIIRKRYTNVFDDCRHEKEYTEPVFSSDTKKDKVGAFDTGLGRYSRLPKVNVSTNLEYRPNYESVYKSATEVTIPKAGRKIYTWLQEEGRESRISLGPDNYFSISASMNQVSKKIGDFSKMGSRKRPALY